MQARFVVTLALGALFLPLFASAATTQSFEVSGWIPYWRAATGTADVLPHLDLLTEVDLFAYTLKSDGTLLDNAGLTKEPWASFIAAAKAKKVRVIPTVMTSNTTLIHTLLSKTSSRVALEDRIAAMVKSGGFDGIDIDFEGKSAADKNYFSTFLKGLYQRMGTKLVMCDIEARTPVGARYYGATVPTDATVYANDFTQINKYCDRVRIMAYDQQGVDLQLSSAAASSSQLYAPVADPLWVEKVVKLAEQSIRPSKILIGVPTYGYEYNVTVFPGSQYEYTIKWSFNPNYAKQIQQQYGLGSPVRNSAGEMQLTYIPTSSTTPPVSYGISALAAALGASAQADTLQSYQTFRLLDWPDAQSIAGKAGLAESLGVRGISIFKLDGGEDPAMWTALLGVKH
jgi:spore germination protein YaaH